MSERGEFQELTDEQYLKLRVMPMSGFPDEHRSFINFQANQPYPPKKILEAEFFRMPSRSWFEWHVRRSGDPRNKRPGLSASVRAAVVERDGMICGICGESIASRKDLHIDHIQPWVLGGSDQIGNLQPAHVLCNLKKGARA